MEPFKTMILTYNSEHKSKSREPFQIGTFHQLLSQCSKLWNICADDHLSYTDASFQIKENVRLALTSLDRNKIRVSVWCTKDSIEPFTSSLILTIRRSLGEMLTKLGLEPKNDFLLLCQHWNVEDTDTCLNKFREIAEGSKIQPVKEVCFWHKKNVNEWHFPGFLEGELF